MWPDLGCSGGKKRKKYPVKVDEYGKSARVRGFELFEQKTNH